MAMPRQVTTSRLIERTIDAMTATHLYLRRALLGRPEVRFNRVMSTDRSTTKTALTIDVAAEEFFRARLNADFRGKVDVFGEETLSTGVIPQVKICALADMVDGTDLFEMGIPLWCSAVVLFNPNPPEPEILGAVVGLANGEIYYASREEAKKTYVRRQSSSGTFELVSGPSNVKSLSQARVAFYGQKAKNFLPLSSSAEFRNTLKGFSDTKTHLVDFRIYNFGGNPAMVKLVDRLRNNEGQLLDRGFDAVFELVGQRPHDVVPGAYLAKTAGAFLCDLDGNEINVLELAQKLLKPNDRMTYIVASTKELARDIRRTVGYANAKRH